MIIFKEIQNNYPFLTSIANLDLWMFLSGFNGCYCFRDDYL